MLFDTTHAKEITKEEQKASAWRMLRDGLSVCTVAKKLKIDHSTVSKYKKEGLEDLRSAGRIDADLYTQDTLEWYDQLLEKALLGINALEDRRDLGDEKAIAQYFNGIGRCVQILDNRNRLLGLNAPLKVETKNENSEVVTVDVDYASMSLDELKRLYAEKFKG